MEQLPQITLLQLDNLSLKLDLLKMQDQVIRTSHNDILREAYLALNIKEQDIECIDFRTGVITLKKVDNKEEVDNA